MAEDELGSQSEIAKRLRIARENAGLSQSQIARIMKLHRPTISEIEAGRRKVTGTEITQFAEHYGVDADWILGTANGGTDPRIALAARELAKLDPADIHQLMDLLRTLKKA